MALSRRALIGGAGALALGVPLARQAAWSARDFGRPGFSPDLPAPPPGRQAWQNWSGLQRATPQAITFARSEADVADVLAEAAGPVRAVGSGHSFVPLVPTEGTILDIGPLAGVIAEDKAAGTITLGAGTRLQHAARLLAERGMAFANLSDIDTQTLAGMFSTSTHGTGRELRAIHDHVEGFRIVLADGTVRDVTRTSDAALFQAGKVSLGTLGIITRYTLRPVPAFALHRKVWVEDLASLLPRAESLWRDHRNFEFYYLPGTGRVAAITHDLHTGPVKGRPPSEDEETLAGLRALRDSVGWSNWLKRRLALHELPDGVTEDSTDESWKLLATGRLTKFNEMEYELPQAQGLAALNEVLALADATPELYFPIEVRLTAPDDAWLSMFHGGPRMSISLHCDAAEEYQFLFDRFEPVLRRYGGRPHWGKLHSLKSADLARLYPRFADFVALRRQLDSKGKLMTPYLEGLLGG